ncbi:MAG: Gfo/Idh/MocA family oxidoreductase [Chloroflexi bacterium]|nr:Gfo/Idh/MocA family oxidoreductase [Chloroflexota bacterium]
MTTEPTVALALVGCGSFALDVEATLGELPAARIVAVCDVEAASAERFGRRLGVPAFTDLHQLLRRSDAEAVVIMTPHATHRDLTVAAAQAGRHVFCEKAMAVNVAQCHEMVQAAEANGVKLMVGHKRRLRPAFARMGEVLRSGELGAIQVLTVTGYHDRQLAGWWTRRSEVGGLMFWAGVHDVDTLRFLCGEVASVYAVAGPKTHGGTDYTDSISAVLRFRSGAVGSIQVSPYYPLRQYRTSFGFEIVCEHGGMSYDPRSISVVYQATGGERHELCFPDYGFETAFRQEFASFLAWIVRDEPPLLTGLDGLRCVEILQAMELSMARGSVICLPLAHEERGP